MQHQLLAYSKNDVAILGAVVIKFSNIMQQITNGIQYFLVSATIASLVMRVFRTLYLPEDTIPVIAPLRYHIRDRKTKPFNC